MTRPCAAILQPKPTGACKMTTFVKKNFHYHGGFLTYTMPSGAEEFIARFKHRGPVTKAKFVKSIIKNYSVEQYLYQVVVNRKAPLQILKDDGHLLFDGASCVFYLDGKPLSV